MNIAIVNCFDTYEHRVELLYDYFKENGNNVRVYTSDFRHIEKTHRTESRKDFIMIHSLGYKKNISTQRLISHYKTAKDLFSSLEFKKIDLLWVLVPPNSFVKEAASFKMRHNNVKLIFDIIDMWPEAMPLNKFEKIPFVTKWRNLRNDYISYADHVVTECNLFQEKLEEVVDPQKMTTILLARKADAVKWQPNPPEDKIVLCYLGSINNIIDIPTIADIIKRCRKVKPVILHIIGDGEKCQELISSVKLSGADVVYHGKVYDSGKKQKIFDSCHYGLNIMKSSVFVGLTMKSLDYFEAGLPIINNIHGDTWDIIDNYGIGLNWEADINTSLFSDYDFSMRERTKKYFAENMTHSTFVKNLSDVVLKIQQKIEGKVT